LDLLGTYFIKPEIVKATGGSIEKTFTPEMLTSLPIGEIYISHFYPNIVRGWKRHREMELRLLPIIGDLKIVMTVDKKHFKVVPITENKRTILVVPSGIWFSIASMGSHAALINFASSPHNESEIERLGLDEITFDWRKI